MQRWLVSGRVQGVGFRFFVLREATALGLRGTVRNMPDGSVEVIATGQPDELAKLEARLNDGPDAAKVDDVQRSEHAGDPDELPAPFEIIS